MRVYPHWFVRYFGIAAGIIVAVVAGESLISSNFDPTRWGFVALAVIMLTFGARAAIGGVEVTPTEYIVRNWLQTRRIPRPQVTGFTSASVLWSVQWKTDDGVERFVPLSWFSNDAPGPIRRYNAATIESLRAIEIEPPST